MTGIIVNHTCISCGLCVKVCPMGVFAIHDSASPAKPSHSQACALCGHCLANCPVNAISISGLTTENFADGIAPCSYEALRELVRKRRSVRFFLDKTVPKSTFDEILDATRYAPTARNSQGVHYTVVMAPTKVQQLSGLAIEWFSANNVTALVKQWENGYDIIDRHAPHLVIVHSTNDTAKPVEDATIALTTFELLANAKGLGTCWAGFFMSAAFNYAPLHKALQLPPEHKVRGALMVGYSAVVPQRIPKRPAAKAQFI